jgi:hypothetical protein
MYSARMERLVDGSVPGKRSKLAQVYLCVLHNRGEVYARAPLKTNGV